ncbi:unnamed protein product [Schistosoma intercalatum]|nr:unnamed protein product [Schistosoma intercalatum]
MMFEYTSDYLAEKLRENWLTRNGSNQFILDLQEQDDSLTNLNWLQTLNIHEFTSRSSPISPPLTPPLHLINSTHSVYASTSTTTTTTTTTTITTPMTTWNSSSQKVSHFNPTLNHYKRNVSTLFNGLQHRNENNTFPYINNYSKHRFTYNIHNNIDHTTDINNHNNYISSSIAITNKQYKDSPLKCLNNTINFYSNYNPIPLDHIPISTTTNALRSNNNNNSSIDCQRLLNTVHINTGNVNPNDNDPFSTNSIYDLHNVNNNNVNNPNSYICSLRNSNISRFEHHKLRKNDHHPQQQSMNLTDINFIINSSTTDIFNHNSSQVIYKKINNTTTNNNSNTNTTDYTNSINHSTPIESYYYYITENNKLFMKYDTLSIQEKEIYQYNANDKPLFNSHTLIYMAMMSLKKNKITFNDICDWIKLHFAFYRYQNDNYWWQDIIRKHLTCSRCFQRVPKRKEELDGRSDLWRINPELHNQLINNKISNKFLLAWQNQTLPKLPDLIDFIEPYNSISKLSSEINNYQRKDHHDHLIINDNDNNQFINSSKRKCINQIENHLIDLNKSSNIYLNIDQTTQSNSSSSPELSDFYTSSPSELLPEPTTDLTLFIDNEYYLNTSLNSISFNDNINNKNNNNNNNNSNSNNNLLRNNILHHSIHSSPLNLTEQEQCDLQALFNDQETHSILNDHFYYTSTSSISSFDLNDNDNNNDNNGNNNNNHSNDNHNNNGLIVEELSKASGLNEIPPINDFDNDELIDPLDLTIHNVHSRLTNDWWSNHSNIINNMNHDSLSESMTNFINSTLNELENKEKEEENNNDGDKDDDGSGGGGGDNDDEVLIRRENNGIDQRINETFTSDIINPIIEKLVLNNKQNDINQVKLHVNSLSSDLLTNELSFNQTLSLLSSSSDLTILSPRLLSITNQTEMIESSSSSSSSSSSIPPTSSMISKLNYYSKTNETNRILNEDDAFFHQFQLNTSINKHNNNNNHLIPFNHINDHNDIEQENMNHHHNNSLEQTHHQQQWLDHKMNFDDLDNILGLH